MLPKPCCRRHERQEICILDSLRINKGVRISFGRTENAKMIHINSNKLAGQRKEHWEGNVANTKGLYMTDKIALRNNNVPRYLFRAFSSKSGGGLGKMINNAHEVRPHGFMHGRQGHEFYDMTESQIYFMAHRHFRGDITVVTEFSSWAASLHLVLSYAFSMPSEHNPHVAIMDCKALDRGVLVWHATHLIGLGEEEYLAHGVVRGKGYKAVSLKDLFDHGLRVVFPEILTDLEYDNYFGILLKVKMFRCEPIDISESEALAIKRMGGLFGDLSLPVMTALSCLRPRPWNMVEDSGISDAQIADRVIKLFDIDKVNVHPASEPWLKPNAVFTKDEEILESYPEIEQWMWLLRAISQPHRNQVVERKTYNLRDLPGRRK